MKGQCAAHETALPAICKRCVGICAYKNTSPLCTCPYDDKCNKKNRYQATLSTNTTIVGRPGPHPVVDCKPSDGALRRTRSGARSVVQSCVMVDLNLKDKELQWRISGIYGRLLHEMVMII
ncbi:unnamed protein product [Clavelina lepadiformis]|uniref:Uncharacterized protein n=1 Tax=Clavelina lepadiformis TaxID=159417 RepID=A0ABP0EW44_CLALP